MTIQEALRKDLKIEIDLLLSCVLGKPKEFLFLRPEYRLTRTQERRLTRMIKRRSKGEPMAYILGYKDFCGLRFKVGPAALIPRPETEELVEIILEIIWNQEFRIKNQPPLFSKEGRGEFKILDLGTGSGCIIISIAHELQKLKARPELVERVKGQKFILYASDISAKALRVAKKNAELILGKKFDTTEYRSIYRNSKPVKFVHSDLFRNIPQRFDYVIANLPYVTKKNYELRITNLEWEPKTALTDGTGRWKLYQNFFQQLSGRLEPGGLAFLEIDPESKKKIRAWTKKYLPRAAINFANDSFGRVRFAIIST